MLMDVGLDGRGPLRPATSIADAARRRTGYPEEAVERVVRLHVVGGMVGGFVTGLGGFVTMPVAVPVNVAEFYVQATRMVGAIATLRGYDVRDPDVRTAVLLTLVGAKADEVLAKAGLTTGGGAITKLAMGKLPPAALMVINKAISFRLMRGVFERLLLAVRPRRAVRRRHRRRRDRRLDDAGHRRAGHGGVPAAVCSERRPGRWSAVSKDETPISDQLKKVVDDLDLESKVQEATAAAEQAVLRGLEATGSYLRDHRADIEGFFERAGAAIDRQTSGRYAGQVEQVRGQLTAGLASLTDRQWAPLDREPDELEAPEVSAALDSPDVTAPEERPGSVEPDVAGDAHDEDGWAGSTDQV